jgi:hypothetical protein
VCCIKLAHRCLATALGDLETKGLMGEHKVNVRAINPKVSCSKGPVADCRTVSAAFPACAVTCCTFSGLFDFL